MDPKTEYEKLWEGALPGESLLERTAGFEELLPTKTVYEAGFVFRFLAALDFAVPSGVPSLTR